MLDIDTTHNGFGLKDLCHFIILEAEIKNGSAIRVHRRAIKHHGNERHTISRCGGNEASSCGDSITRFNSVGALILCEHFVFIYEEPVGIVSSPRNGCFNGGDNFPEHVIFHSPCRDQCEVISGRIMILIGESARVCKA